MTVPEVRAVGIVLAAGAGTRAGGPKALRPGWLERAVAALGDGGCEEVIVVLGARVDDAVRLIPADARAVVAPDWRSGISASLRAGLSAATATTADVALITLVDLPGMPAAAVSRMLETDVALARAGFEGRPGHPVRVAREHWSALSASASGDVGAGPYLRDHGVTLVECGDLWDGEDEDGPPGGAAD